MREIQYYWDSNELSWWLCNAANEKLLRAVICAGLYPNVAKLFPGHKPNR